MKVSLVVPTYQERDNLVPLVKGIDQALQGLDYEIIIVDDDSPDGTAEVARALTDQYPIRVIKRRGVRGLGSAVIEGFRHAQGDVVGVMDADLQHPPEVVPRLVEPLRNGSDVAVASRYVPGGGVEGWSLSRRIVSKGATLLARPLTKVKDPMSGCFMLSRGVADEIHITPKGYKLLLQILVTGNYRNATEVPYVFRNRLVGKSKLGSGEFLRYLSLLRELYGYRLSWKGGKNANQRRRNSDGCIECCSRDRY